MIFGDFNYGDIDRDRQVRSSNATPECSDFLDCVMESSLHQHVCESTRHDGLLDLGLTSDEDLTDAVSNLGKFDARNHDMLCCNINWRSSMKIRSSKSRLD